MRRLHFIAMGANAGVGGFSSYFTYLDHHFSKFRNVRVYGQIGQKNLSPSVCLFAPASKRKKRDLLFLIATIYNYAAFNLVLLYCYVFCKSDPIWVQVTFLARNPLPFKKILYRKLKLIIDVRDSINIALVDELKPYAVITCGKEIKMALSHAPKGCYEITTPIPLQDQLLLEDVLNSKYVVFAHGIQSDKVLTDLNDSINYCLSRGYKVFIAGRQRVNRKTFHKLTDKNGVFFLGILQKHVLFHLIKNSAGLILFSKMEGVSRVALETIALGNSVYSKHKFNDLADYDNYFPLSKLKNDKKLSNSKLKECAQVSQINKLMDDLNLE